MPLAVYSTRDLPPDYQVRVEAAVIHGGENVEESYEAWIALDAVPGGVKVMITGPHGFERLITFAADEAPCAITERVRQALIG